MKVLCSICARGGSKGVKNKNVRELNSIPLIAHSILQAKESNLFDVISVSSDCDQILSIAKEYGADFLIKRPDDLATDTSAKLPVIQHCFSESEKESGMNFDFVIDLDATSPLRKVSDIKGVFDILQSRSEEIDNVITGCHARRSPYFNLVEENESGFSRLVKSLEKGIVRRQDSPRCFDMNASIYGWSRNALLNSDKVLMPKTVLFEMSEETAYDIDSELDFKIVELLMRDRNE
ncbi:cytidylyltransferase domain-containing protein [Halobacteriovorax sp. HLS]|uniref:acylneuraminate cytidylyltransferase family protein n=1 Tax=Halobacteriovorax sp. HLS TaxID=2234000 RepID=UPI000FD85247|nr:acylneuraminate cytidylyltransferase family protein [Halobacteriovorax sp. HLS]